MAQFLKIKKNIYLKANYIFKLKNKARFCRIIHPPQENYMTKKQAYEHVKNIESNTIKSLQEIIYVRNSLDNFIKVN